MKTNLRTKLQLAAILFLSSTLMARAQEKSVENLDQKFLNWHNRDPLKDNTLGTSVDRAYAELIVERTPKKTVIVAVIDGGVDINHEDLKGRIWVNEDEIPGNNIDDDRNGYVDDIHGWNFIGNKNGENVMSETMEYTRVYRTGGGPDFAKAKKLYEKELNGRLEEKKNIERFEEIYYKAKAKIKDKTGITVNGAKDLDAISPDYSEDVMAAKRFLEGRYAMGFNEKILAEMKQQNLDYVEKFLSLEFNPRTIVGDDPANINDTGYGNPDVKGPRSDHGTSVAGIIAAIRSNGSALMVLPLT